MYRFGVGSHKAVFAVALKINNILCLNALLFSVIHNNEGIKELLLFYVGLFKFQRVRSVLVPAVGAFCEEQVQQEEKVYNGD